jgi:outer membrane beta-barrel protein
MHLTNSVAFFFFALLACAALPARAGEGNDSDSDQLMEGYWSRGERSALDVLQNRLYSKHHKLTLAAGAGNLLGNPFLTTYTYGASIGYHLSEFLSLHAIGWRSPSWSSGDRHDIESSGLDAAVNPPRYFLGGEAHGSIIDGKMSPLGLLVAYFDLYLSAGAGALVTDAETELALTAGIGQSLYLSSLFSLDFDFKLLRYHDTRTNLSALVAMSVGFHFDPIASPTTGKQYGYN